MIRDLKDYDKMIGFVRQLQIDPKKEIGIEGWASQFALCIDGKRILSNDGKLHHFYLSANFTQE